MGKDLRSSSAPYVAGSTATTDAWAAEAAAAGGKGSQRIIHAGRTAAPPAIAEALGSTDVVVRRRLVLLNDRPVELADAYYPAAVAADTPLAEPAKIKGGAAAYLAARGYTAARTVEEIRAHAATDAERAELELAVGEPVLVLTRLSTTADGTPFEYAVMTMRAEGRVLRYEQGPAA